MLSCLLPNIEGEVEIKSQSHETNDADFSYKEISIVSDATEDVQADSQADHSDNDELADYQILLDGTRKKM